MKDKKNDINNICREARKLFRKLPNVPGVGYGYKQTANKSTGKLSLIVYVESKKPDNK